MKIARRYIVNLDHRSTNRAQATRGHTVGAQTTVHNWPLRVIPGLT